MKPRLAVVVSQPIQHLPRGHREVAYRDRVDARVFYGCDWCVEESVDPDFGQSFEWVARQAHFNRRCRAAGCACAVSQSPRL